MTHYRALIERGETAMDPAGKVSAVNCGRLLPTARKTDIPPSDLEILPGMTTDASGNRPLTGGARMSPSAAKVHSIGSILTVLSSVFFAISFLCTLTGVPGGNTASLPTYNNAKVRLGSCNPFLQPGYISHSPFPLWKTFDPSCPPSTVLPDMLATLPKAKQDAATPLRSLSVSSQRQVQLMQGLRNKTVVLVGDAVDRTMIMDLCEMVGEQPVAVDSSHPWGAALKQLTFPGKNMADALLADYCYVPQYSTIFTSFYHYGADTNELWRYQQGYYPPGNFEKRVSDLLKPYLESMASRSASTNFPNLPRALSSRPDLVVFSSSLWDLAAWALQDKRDLRTNANDDLSDKRINWWRTRMVDMIEELRKQLGPSTPIAWRSTHVPMTKVNDTVEWFFTSMHARSTPAPIENGQQFAYPNRIAQLNNARNDMLQLSSATNVRGQTSKIVWSMNRQPALRNIPFGELTLGQSMNQDTLVNPGFETYAYMFWSMVLHELFSINT